ncbi:MAG: hypothetical protein NVS3B1_11730 [Marmoricola sp.]
MKTVSRRVVFLLLAAAATVVGLVLLIAGLNGQATAPAVHVAGQIDPPTRQSTPTGLPLGSATVPLKPSKPTRLRIPALGIDTAVNPIGLNPDGTLMVPQPGPHLNQAAWFKNSPTPGQLGASIIEGHVDSVDGKSVFWRLGDIKPGDRIAIDRLDGARLIFTVNAVRDYPKARFPTLEVYGGDLSQPTLRLITCSDFNPAIRHHTGDEVVYAHLTQILRRP